MVNSYPLIVKQLAIRYYKKGNTIRNTINIFGISKSSLFNWLKHDKQGSLSEKKNNITFKKINKNKQLLKNKIKEFNKSMKKVKLDEIISIDEISFDTNIFNHKGWSKKGNKINKMFNYNRKRYTIICGISNKKCIHYKIVKNSAKKEDFYNFIKDLTLNIENKSLLLDNARIHHSRIIKQYVNTTSNKLLFNIPYNPETNPIEMYFSKFKRLVRSRSDNENNLIKNINKLIHKTKSFEINKYFKKSIGHLSKQ